MYGTLVHVCYDWTHSNNLVDSKIFQVYITHCLQICNFLSCVHHNFHGLIHHSFTQGEMNHSNLLVELGLVHNIFQCISAGFGSEAGKCKLCFQTWGGTLILCTWSHWVFYSLLCETAVTYQIIRVTHLLAWMEIWGSRTWSCSIWNYDKIDIR